MNGRTQPLASIPVQVWLPGETQGAFTERFLEATRGKPPELVALVVWRMCERAFLDGCDDAPLARAERELCQFGGAEDNPD